MVIKRGEASEMRSGPPHVRHTSARTAIRPICCGHIDRIIRRPLRCHGSCGLLPEGFAISRGVWASLTYCAFVTLGP
jgi:hypothetical protein